MNGERHPFVEWWIEESGYYRPCEDWRATLISPEGRAAVAAWNAALKQVDRLNATHIEGINLMPEQIDLL